MVTESEIIVRVVGVSEAKTVVDYWWSTVGDSSGIVGVHGDWGHDGASRSGDKQHF